MAKQKKFLALLSIGSFLLSGLFVYFTFNKYMRLVPPPCSGDVSYVVNPLYPVLSFIFLVVGIISFIYFLQKR